MHIKFKAVHYKLLKKTRKDFRRERRGEGGGEKQVLAQLWRCFQLVSVGSPGRTATGSPWGYPQVHRKQLEYSYMLNDQGLSGDSSVETKLLSDHFAFKITIPTENTKYTRRKRFTLPTCNIKIKQLIENISEGNRMYTPSNLDTYYEDVIIKIVKALQVKQRTKERIMNNNSNK